MHPGYHRTIICSLPGRRDLHQPAVLIALFPGGFSQNRFLWKECFNNSIRVEKKPATRRQQLFIV